MVRVCRCVDGVLVRRAVKTVAAWVLGLGAVGGWGGGGGHALAQFSFSEPPELVGQLVGSVSPDAGATNRVIGGIGANFTVNGLFFGDKQDQFVFVVPPGVRADMVSLLISNYSAAQATSQAMIIGPNVNMTRSFDASSSFTLAGPVVAGTYTVIISSQSASNSPGSISFNYELSVTATQNNDACADALRIGLGTTVSNNFSATTDGPTHPDACNEYDNPGIEDDVWFTYTPTAPGQMTASTCQSSFDTEIAVYGGDCAALATSLIACNDDTQGCGLNNARSRVQWMAEAGRTYLIRVGAYQNDHGSISLNLALATSGACCNTQNGSCLLTLESTCTGLGLAFRGWGTTCSPSTCRGCAADFNRSGTLNTQDIFDYLNAWFAGCP